MKHKGIIFDMDGTLWDSAENVAKSWNKAIADYGYERAPITKEDMYSVMGKTMDVLASIIFPNCTCRDELINVCYREDEAVYVGDIQGDYDSSKKAGVKFIHAAYGFGTIDDDVPAIRKFSELPRVADRVFDEIEKH